MTSLAFSSITYNTNGNNNSNSNTASPVDRQSSFISSQRVVGKEDQLSKQVATHTTHSHVDQMSLMNNKKISENSNELHINNNINNNNNNNNRNTSAVGPKMHAANIVYDAPRKNDSYAVGPNR